mgnify:CR=1 FL=1
MKTIVVTGAGGYIGSQVVRELAGRGVQVIAVDRSAGAGADETPGVRWVAADLFLVPAYCHVMKQLRKVFAGRLAQAAQ